MSEPLDGYTDRHDWDQAPEPPPLVPLDADGLPEEHFVMYGDERIFCTRNLFDDMPIWNEVEPTPELIEAIKNAEKINLNEEHNAILREVLSSF